MDSVRSLKFIDLFAGIGGMRLAFQQATRNRFNSKCVFSSEWDPKAKETYKANFSEEPAGDLTKIDSSHIPDHDLLLAGFPCQPFSISGVSKKNSLGRPHGFEDKTQGTLFFEVARIIKDKEPRAFLLENVKGLLAHNKGETFKTIYDTLQAELGYDIHVKVIDARDYVPQHRERVFIVGFRDPRSFSFPTARQRCLKMRDILEDKVPDKYILTDRLWAYLQRYAEKHKAAGNGFGFGLTDLEGVSRTLSARYYKDGSEILIPRGPRINPRRLTPRECARLMGFPDSFKIPVSDTQAYKQFGNSVVVPVVRSVAVEMVKSLLQRQASRRLFSDMGLHGRILKTKTKPSNVAYSGKGYAAGAAY
jgi:DNA (cytosine-5)-methyltransferase 1